MKKFWNLMLVAFIALGATACEGFENPFDKGNGTKGESFSFIAEIDTTRADVVANGEGWQTVWTGDDKLSVVADGATYIFVNSADALTRFTSTDEGAATIADAKNVVISTYHENAGVVDSDAGKRGLSLSNVYESFPADRKVSLSIQSAFFRYSSDDEVTLQSDIAIFSGVNDSKTTEANITLPAGKDIWVPFAVRADSIALAAVIGTEAVLTVEALEIEKGMIYNLGELKATEKPEEIKPEHKIYVRQYKNNWSTLYLYSWDDTQTYTDLWPGVTHTEIETINGYDYFVWTMPTVATDKDINIIINKGEGGEGNQTADFNLGVLSKDYYVLLNGTELSIIEDCCYPEPATTWALAGDFNDWGNTVMATTETPNLFVAKAVELTSGKKVKVKDATTWDVNFGGGITNLEPNKWMTLAANGADIAIAKSGVYDVYFQYASESKLYLVEADGDYTTATEQTANGTLVPDEPENPGEDPENPDQPENPGDEFVSVASEWALLGNFSSWADTMMMTTPDANVVVLEGVALNAGEGFLVRKPSTDWADKYGAGDANYIKTNHYIVTVNNGADMSVETSGVYDVYFNYSNCNLYVVEVGADYTTATLQTVNGEEPKQEEPEVTDKVVYLKPSSNWMEKGARFAIYVWNDGGTQWVSMTDCGDGTYEAFLPEGYDYGCNIIFCRMNPGTSANNWNNKWNQTADLKTPTDGNNMYTVTEGTWDNGGGSWSKK
ncbi:MAG: hypothetical protein J6V55_00645 [Alistipes sp.]|nr:hypothetical protein [Alistipes sp.]